MPLPHIITVCHTKSLFYILCIMCRTSVILCNIRHTISTFVKLKQHSPDNIWNACNYCHNITTFTTPSLLLSHFSSALPFLPALLEPTLTSCQALKPVWNNCLLLYLKRQSNLCLYDCVTNSLKQWNFVVKIGCFLLNFGGNPLKIILVFKKV